MKNLLLLAFLTVFTVNAQKKIENLETYTASNGVTYSIGDEFQLGRGSDTNGKFVYVNVGGWAVSSSAEQNRLGSLNVGLIVTVKKIKKYNYKRYKGVYFTVGGGNITNYTIDIENAISSCEVIPCKSEPPSKVVVDKYDKLKKLKELLDSGILTKEEFENEKAKILN